MRHPCTPDPSERGFTLIEIMVTVLILVTGLAGLVMMAVGSTRSSAASMNFNRGTAYGEELLEQMRERDYDDLELDANIASGPGCDPAGNPPWDIPGDQGVTDEDLPGNPTQITFERDVTVTCLPDSTLKRVIVEVRWDDEVSTRRGTPHSIKFETYRTPDPL